MLHPPAADPGITEDERRTITEMMAKGTYAGINLATPDVDATFERLQAQRRRGRAGADRPAVGHPRLRLPRPRGQHDPHLRGALSRAVDRVPITEPMSTATDDADARTHAADSHDLIRVHGARENNLKDVSVEIPKRRLTVFTGVSGSGKSSLVFDTIAAESQRLINETYSAFVQGFMPTLGRPDVDVLDGLTTAIIVDQERMGANPRSTVGTATDANAMLRILFSRLGQPHVGSPQAFSFNVASISGAGAVTIEKAGQKVKERRSFTITGGMCPRCEGRGAVNDIDLAAALRRAEVAQRGRDHDPRLQHGRLVRAHLPRLAASSTRTSRSATTPKQELDDLLYKEPTKIKVEGINLTYEGLIPQIQKSMLSKDVDALQPHIRAFVERAVTFTACPECDGTRLTEARAVVEDQGHQHRRRLRDADQRPRRVGARPRRAVGRRRCWRRCSTTLDSFVEIGLGYLVARPAVGHAVGRRGAAHQDDPPPRLGAHRRHLRLRRADRSACTRTTSSA